MSYSNLESRIALAFGGMPLSFGTPRGGVDAMEEEAPLLPIKLGKELAIINDCSVVCLGKVGGTKVCLCVANECRV